MKKIFPLVALIIIAISSMACQNLYDSFGFSGTPKSIELFMHNASVRVVGYKGSEIKIEMLEGYNNETDNRRSEGLKPLSGLGTDNTGKGLAMKAEGGKVKITKVTRQEAKYLIKVPQNANVILKETTWTGGGDYKVENLSGNVEVKTKVSDIAFRNISGAIKVRSTSGNVKMYFDTWSNKAHDISLISGDIDITIPVGAKTSLEMKTISGEVYTDFDFPQDKTANSEYAQIGGGTGTNVRRLLNGGGVTTRLKTISSNIYLRKKK